MKYVHLSVSDSAKDPQSGLNYNGIQKVKEGCVEDSQWDTPQRLNDFLEGDGTDFVPLAQFYNEEIEKFPIMGHAYGAILRLDRWSLLMRREMIIY